MKKRIFSILLCICMVCSLLPVTAGAEDGHTNHCVCAVENCDEEGHGGGIEWHGTSTLPTSSGNYYLTSDVNLGNSSWEVPTGSTNLCLNGHKISSPGNNNYTPITVTSGAVLTITDCSTDNERVGIQKESNLSDDNLDIIAVVNHGSLTVTGNVKISATSQKSPTLAIDSFGTLTVTGNAKISASNTAYNSTKNAYGVCNNGEGTFTLSGSAQITAASTKAKGYGVWNKNTMYISGAPTVSSKTADIYLTAGDVITLNGVLTQPSTPIKIEMAALGAFTSGWSTYMSSATPSDYFKGTETTYTAQKVGNELNLIDHTHNWSYELIGTTLTATCGATGCYLTDSKCTATVNVALAAKYGDVCPVTVTNDGWVAGEITVVDNGVTPKGDGLEGSAAIKVNSAQVGDAVSYTMSKGDNSFTTAPASQNPTYSGSPQALVSAGVAKGGTVQYKLGDGAWSETVPTATNAGTYTVYCKAVGNDYYSDVDEVPVIVTVAKASAPTLPDITDSFKYTTTSGEKTIGTAGMPADAGTLEYAKDTESKTGSVTVSSWDVDANGKVTYTLTGGAAGDTITLSITIKSTNYADSTVNVKFTLTAKDGQAALNITGGSTVEYGKTLTLSTTGGSGTGAVTYAVSDVSGEASIDGNVLTANKVGTVTVTATKAEDNNYSEASSTPVTITITKATPTGAPTFTAITAADKTLADAALSVGSITPAGGTIVWDLGNAQSVVANTAYAWTYTPADTTNYNVLTGSITPYVVSSGGGWYDYDYTPPSYKVEDVTPDKADGSITSDHTNAQKGDDVTITVTSDRYYNVDGVIVKDKNGKEIPVTMNQDGTFSFEMPAGEVTVEPIFVWDNPFVDVDEETEDAEPVEWALKNGITTGATDTTFAPDGDCTRAQIVTFLWRAAGSPEPTGSAQSFADVDADDYFAKAVLWALENGITTGVTDTTFAPDAVCTRAQTVTFLHRAAGKPATEQGSAFDDVAADSYYAQAVAWAEANGITKGIGGSLFGSLDECTRIQIVTFLYRFLGELAD